MMFFHTHKLSLAYHTHHISLVLESLLLKFCSPLAVHSHLVLASLLGILLGHGVGLGHFLPAAVHDLDILDRLVAPVSLVGLNLPHHVHAANNLSKDDVPAVEPRSLLSCDEELRSVSVLPGVGHGQPPSAVVLQLEVLICKLFSVDRSSPCAISSCEVSSLQHEVLNDPVELRLLVTFTLGLLGELHEVLHSLGHSLAEQTHLYLTHIFSSNLYLKPDLVRHLRTLLLGRRGPDQQHDSRQHSDQCETFHDAPLIPDCHSQLQLFCVCLLSASASTKCQVT